MRDDDEMPEKEVDFSLLVRPEALTREFGKGELISRKATIAMSSSSSCAERSRSGAATVASKLSAKTAFLARWP
jgi:hypothetical protein